MSTKFGELCSNVDESLRKVIFYSRIINKDKIQLVHGDLVYIYIVIGILIVERHIRYAIKMFFLKCNVDEM